LLVLTASFGDRGNGGERPAVKRRRRRRWCSVSGDWGRGEERRSGVASAVQSDEGGVHFIWPGRRWRGCEEASGGGFLIPVGFEGVKGVRKDRMALIQWGK
jgi:hypothetical protein